MPSVKRKIEAADERLVAWVRDWATLAQDMAVSLGTPLDGPIPEPQALERMWDEWLANGLEGTENESVVRAVGCAFGEHLAQRWSLNWVTATDEWGTDIAVHGSPGDVLLFPVDFVSKRAEEHEHLPLQEASNRLGVVLEKAKAEWRTN